MKQTESTNATRRNFVKAGGLAAVPMLLAGGRSVMSAQSPGGDQPNIKVREIT